MYTRDGVRLDADLYGPTQKNSQRPETPLPALLMRQPYGRRIASTLVYAHPRWYAAQGYLVIIQDVRGRGTSAGTFDLLAHEVEDGEDCLHWVAQLPECNGAIGMYGFSYQGMTQLLAAASHHPALKTLCPAMIAWDLYQDWAYENGAFCLQNNLGWAIQLAADSAKRAGDESRFNRLVAAARTDQHEAPNGANPDWFQQLAPESFYHQWLNCPPHDEYWQRRSPGAHWHNPTIPVLQIGGWFDPHLRGNLRLYQALKAAAVTQKLIIGPWGHFPWGRRIGNQDYGAAAVSPIDSLQLAWFDHYLKQQPARFEPSRLELFDVGTHQWRHLSDFPAPEQQQHWYLQSQGLGTISGSGLSPVPVTRGNPDVWVHDPWRPVPSLGGHAASPAGPFDRASLDDRADVATYTSPPFDQPITVCGSPQLSLTIEADCPSFDLAIAVSEVTAAGRVLPFSHGIIHSPPSDKSSRALNIPLQAICVTLSVGSCLRVSLSGASFPAYPVNSGTEQLPTQSTRIAHQIITLAVMSNGNQPAVLILPILAHSAYPNSREASP